MPFVLPVELESACCEFTKTLRMLGTTDQADISQTFTYGGETEITLATKFQGYMRRPVLLDVRLQRDPIS